jgi:DNA (cytosine-5)-methyltransferase 1
MPWETIQRILHDLGYCLTKEPLILSPHQFGVPQLRERVCILGKYEPENVDAPLEIKLPKLKAKKKILFTQY